MQVELNEFGEYVVIAGNGNKLNRYKVKGDKIGAIYAKFERVCYIGKIQCFECYTKNPETGEGGWDIVYIEGVKEKIKAYYPDFDTFITQDSPSDGDIKEFLKLEHNDYDMAELEDV
jgi:hypothetical protein